MSQQEQQRRVKARKKPGAWVLELDEASWVDLMDALTRAIALEVTDGRAEGERVATFRALRSALSRG